MWEEAKLRLWPESDNAPPGSSGALTILYAYNSMLAEWQIEGRGYSRSYLFHYLIDRLSLLFASLLAPGLL